jgi:hypothetical protein
MLATGGKATVGEGSRALQSLRLGCVGHLALDELRNTAHQRSDGHATSKPRCLRDRGDQELSRGQDSISVVRDHTGGHPPPLLAHGRARREANGMPLGLTEASSACARRATERATLLPSRTCARTRQRRGRQRAGNTLMRPLIGAVGRSYVRRRLLCGQCRSFQRYERAAESSAQSDQSRGAFW